MLIWQRSPIANIGKKLCRYLPPWGSLNTFRAAFSDPLYLGCNRSTLQTETLHNSSHANLLQFEVVLLLRTGFLSHLPLRVVSLNARSQMPMRISRQTCAIIKMTTGRDDEIEYIPERRKAIYRIPPFACLVLVGRSNSRTRIRAGRKFGGIAQVKWHHRQDTWGKERQQPSNGCPKEWNF